MSALEASIPMTWRAAAWSARARPGWVGAVVVGHLIDGWGLLQGTSVREVVVEMAPLMVKLVDAAPVQAPPPPPPPPPVTMPSPPPLALPVIAPTPTAALNPAAMAVSQPPA